MENKRISEEHDIAVISDVHLHTRTPPGVVEALVRLFLRLADDPAPCRMILAGDFFDFSMANAVPAPSEAGFDVSPREKRFGLDPTGEKTAWKIDLIFGQHPALLPAMARFTSRGNEIVLVPGNHDEEILLPEVQEHLRHLLEGSAGDPDRVRFSPWFYHEPGRVYVEHGHFYDPDNAPSSPLRPCPIPAGSQVVLPLGALVTRYLLSVLRGYDSRGDADRTPWPLLIKVFRSNGIHAPGIIYRYYAMAARVLRMAWARTRGTVPPVPEETPGRFADRAGVSREQLGRLIPLTAEPTTDSVRRIMARLYLDRSAAFAAFVISTVLLLPRIMEGGTWSLGVPALSLGVLLFTIRHGNLFGNKTSVACRQASERIREALDVPYVVMGHAHSAEKHVAASPEGRERTYINTGSFGESVLDGADEASCFFLHRAGAPASLEDDPTAFSGEIPRRAAG